MQQQGFAPEDEAETRRHFRSLLFQPVIVGVLLGAAIVFQAASIFVAIGVVLWFNALVPRYNPFERFYDAFVGRRRGYAPLPPAPPPRRFMQGMAGTLMLLAGGALLAGWTTVAYVLEAVIAVAFSTLLFGKFCVGAYLYHVLRGRTAFANETCPWSTQHAAS